MRYTSGKRAVLTFEKGSAGAQVMQNAFDAWAVSPQVTDPARTRTRRIGRSVSLDARARSSRLAIVALDRFLHLLEGTDLDLPDALAGDAELAGQVLQRDRILGETPRLEDCAARAG